MVNICVHHVMMRQSTKNAKRTLRKPQKFLKDFPMALMNLETILRITRKISCGRLTMLTRWTNF